MFAPDHDGCDKVPHRLDISAWDPLRSWPGARPWIWGVLAVWVCLFQGPSFLQSLRPARDNGVDFFQEWASARNLFAGLPVYGNLKDAIQRHLGLAVNDGSSAGVQVVVDVNAHPPTSVLATAPFALLDYPNAVLAWNLFSLALFFISLAMIGKRLGPPFSPWHV